MNEADPKESVIVNIMKVKLALNLEADKEELYWAQRARSNWLKFGDRNTTYFHRLATQRSKRNKVTKLENESGVEIEGEGNLQVLATRYFEELFTTIPVQDNAMLMNRIEPCIEGRHNEALIKEFSADEIYEATKAMAPLKAVGNDGFPSFFFQKYWHLVGSDVTRYCFGGFKLGERVGYEQNKHCSYT